MMRVKTISAVQPSPDGKRMAFAVREAVMGGNRSEYRSQIHVANTDGSDALQLTQGEKSCDNPQWSPDGASIAFLTNRSGKNNVWLIRLRGGEAWQLSDLPGGVSDLRWAPDGSAIALAARDPDSPEENKAKAAKNDAQVVDEHFHRSRLYVVPVVKGSTGKAKARQLTAGEYHVAGFDWSPHAKTIAFAHTPTPRADDWGLSDISVVSISDGAVKPLVHTTAAETAPHYSPDGQWIAFLKSDEPPHWAHDLTVQVVPASGGTPRALAETFNHNPALVGWSADGKQIYYTEAHGTNVRLNSLPLEGSPQELTHDDGVVTAIGLSPTRTAVGFSFQTTNRPQEVQVSRLDNFKPERISAVNRDLPNLPIGETKVQRWQSGDGLEIEGLLTYPVGYEAGKRYPLVLIVHGGPSGVFSQTYTAGPSQYPVAVFSARGYAVLRCNPRGSGGYGKKFRYANYKDWGGGDFRDLMAGVDRVIRDGIADPDRLGVMGWSYGGYMTSWTITQTKRFKAASVGAGVTNLMSFTGTADIPGFLPDYLGAEPWDDLDVYRKHSAMFNVKGVSTPTLIQHGDKDERVPISQGYELYNALKRQGCPVKMVVYPRTPHGVQEPKLLLDVMKRNVEWFDKYLTSNKAAEKN
jgi:dipeptidyl aminopeptidase/acylaminoacyl peptidase